MKKLTFTVVLILAFFLVISCAQESSQELGYVDLMITSSEARTLQATSMDLDTITIVIEKKESDQWVSVYTANNIQWNGVIYESNNYPNNPKQTLRIELPLGSYRATVTGKNSESIVVAVGTSSFNLTKANTGTLVSIILSEPDGPGYLLINIASNDSSQVWDYSISQNLGYGEMGNTIEYDSELKAYTDTIELDPGFYTLTISHRPVNIEQQPGQIIFDEYPGQVYTEAVRIIGGTTVRFEMESAEQSTRTISFAIEDARNIPDPIITISPDGEFAMGMRSEDGRMLFHADIDFPSDVIPYIDEIRWLVTQEGCPAAIYPSWTSQQVWNEDSPAWTTDMSFIPKGNGVCKVTLLIAHNGYDYNSNTDLGWIWSKTVEVFVGGGLSIKTAREPSSGPQFEEISLFGISNEAYLDINSINCTFYFKAYNLLPSSDIQGSILSWNIEGVNGIDNNNESAYIIDEISYDVIRLHINDYDALDGATVVVSNGYGEKAMVRLRKSNW